MPSFGSIYIDSNILIILIQFCNVLAKLNTDIAHILDVLQLETRITSSTSMCSEDI